MATHGPTMMPTDLEGRPRRRRGACAPVELQVAALACLFLGACGAQQAATSRPAETERQPVAPAYAIDPNADAKIPSPGAGPDGAEAMMAKAMVGYGKELTNAATRDEEIEQLVRHYMTITRQIFGRFKRQHTASGGAAGSYDPLPSWRYQAQASWVLRDLSARSSVMRQHLSGLAEAQGLDITHAAGKRDRPGRIAYFVEVMDCIYQDARTRAEHGQAYLRKASVLGPQLAADHRSKLLRQELDMMRTTVRCTAMATRRNPQPAP